MTQRTLLDIWKNDPGLQKEFPDVNEPGISGNWTINDWWNKYGAIYYKDVELIQPTAPVYSEDGNALGRFSSEDPTPEDPETDTNTVWLYDKTQKTYRPISSVTALMALTQSKTSEEAFSYVTTLPTSARNEDAWKGKFISSEDAVLDDGKIPETATLIPGQAEGMEGLYGSTENYSKDVETYVGNLIGVVLTPALQKGDITQSVWDANMKDEEQVAKYINAVLYGGYNIPDAIYKDLKAKTLTEKGNEGFANYKAFDPEMTADEWANTKEGLANAENSTLEPPANVLNIDVGLFKNSVFDIRPEAFATLVKPLDITSPEFKEEAKKIEAVYYDIQMQNAQADTEAKKALVNDQWNDFKENLKKKFNIDLSNNSREAWNQIQQILGGAQERGLSNSGIAQEARDRYLMDVREKNQLLRETYDDDLTAQKREWLAKSGSAEDIRAFINESEENRKKAEQWGLIPSEELRNWYSMENLKKLYPNSDEEYLERISRMYIDENGNMRSQLYRDLYSNRYELEEDKRTYQETTLENKKLDEEEKAYLPYTMGNPLSSIDRINKEREEKEKESQTSTNSTGTDPSTEKEPLNPPANNTGTAYDPKGSLSAANLAAGAAARTSSNSTASSQPATKKYTSLLDIYESRPDLQAEFSGANYRSKNDSWDLNDWYNRHGKDEYSNYTLVDRDKQGKDPLYEKKPVTTKR